MVRRPGRFKFLIFLTICLFFAVTLLLQRNNIRERGMWRWATTPFVNLTKPVVWFTTWTQEQVKDLVQGYLYLVNLRQENKILQREIIELRKQHILYQEILNENGRLRALHDWKQHLPLQTVTARVIGASPAKEFQMILVNRGSLDGVAKRNPVITEVGLVGQVYSVTAHSAQVLLMTDPLSTVDGIIERTRARTLVVGKVTKIGVKHPFAMARLEYLNRGSQVSEGDQVVTSGLEGLFPKGLPIGQIQKIKYDPMGIFIHAELIPHVSFSKLEEVFIVTHFE